MNVSNSTHHIEPGTYAIANQSFSAYTKVSNNNKKNDAHIISMKAGDTFLIVEKSKEQYARWPIRILTEGYGSLFVNNLDAHNFIYVKCGNKLVGKSFCISGALNHPKVVYEKIITMHGGEYKTTVTKNLDYLIAYNSGDTTKTIKAQELGIAIIGEYDFLALVG